MVFSLKQNEEGARERLRAFWAGSSLGRPALYVVADNPDFHEAPWPHPEMVPKQTDLLPEWHAWRAESALSGTIYLAEAMPAYVPFFGSGLVTLAQWAGGDYEYNDSAWIQPWPDLWRQPLPRFDPALPAVQALEACLRAAAQVVGGRGLVCPPVMMDGLTTLSMFRTQRQLCLDLLESPEQVQVWSEALTSLYIDGYDHCHRLLQGLGYTDTTTWLGVLAEGRSEAVQCDFAVMLSPEMYERFALPGLRRLTEYLHYSLYHLDGTCQMRFLGLLRTLPRLSGIQWNPEPGAGSPTRWLEALREIRRRRFCLHVFCSEFEQALALTRELGPDGLFLVLPRFPSLAEAERAIRDIERACERR